MNFAGAISYVASMGAFGLLDGEMLWIFFFLFGFCFWVVCMLDECTVDAKLWL